MSAPNHPVEDNVFTSGEKKLERKGTGKLDSCQPKERILSLLCLVFPQVIVNFLLVLQEKLLLLLYFIFIVLTQRPYCNVCIA